MVREAQGRAPGYVVMSGGRAFAIAANARRFALLARRPELLTSDRKARGPLPDVAFSNVAASGKRVARL